VGTKIGFYDRLKEHIPEPAARMIAEEMTSEGELSAKLDRLAAKADLERFATKEDLERFATKEDLERFATKEDLERFATKADLERCATKEDLERFATKADFERCSSKDDLHRVELGLERLRSSMFRWQLMFFVPLWIGVYGTLVAILFRGSP